MSNIARLMPGFCLRFADDFDVGWDDWKPNESAGLVMNVLVVPDGTYEVCSRTINAARPSTNAKWILNVLWQVGSYPLLSCFFLPVGTTHLYSYVNRFSTRMWFAQYNCTQPAKVDLNSCSLA